MEIGTKKQKNNPSLRPRYSKEIVYIILFYFLTSFTLLLNIPILKVVTSFILLTFIPGYVILHILDLQNLGFGKLVPISVGLSISLSILLGFLFNQFAVLLGLQNPLSSEHILSLFMVAYALLFLVALIKRPEMPLLTHPRPHPLWRRYLFLSAILVLTAIAGTQVLNGYNNNALLLFVLFFIPVVIMLAIKDREEIPSNVYAITLLGISLTLQLIVWLRSNYIVGNDVHLEYYLFKMTLENQQLGVVMNNNLDSCLSISLLPVVYQAFMNVPMDELLFKGIFSIICAVTPITIFYISKKYFDTPFAFMAAIFFIFQRDFLNASGSPRTNIGVFFLTLILLVLFSDEIMGWRKKVLASVLLITIVFSYYTASYILLFFIIVALLGGYIIQFYIKTPLRITYGIFASLFALIILWYGQILHTPLKSGIGFMAATMNTLQFMFQEEMRSSTVNNLLTLGSSGAPFLSRIEYILAFISFFFIAVGVLGSFLLLYQHLGGFRYTSLRILKMKRDIDPQYLIIGFTGVCLLFASLIIPYFSKGYEIGRTFFIISSVLSFFVSLGGVILSRIGKINPYWLLLALILPYSLFISGALYEVGGGA